MKWNKRSDGRSYASSKNLSLACYISGESSGPAYGQNGGPFSLVRYNNYATVYAHEIGHNFTMEHGTGGYIRNAEDANLRDDAFYATDLSDNKRTAMGETGATYRIARYSNPNRTYGGFPYGTADRNNAAIVRDKRTTVQGWRSSW